MPRNGWGRDELAVASQQPPGNVIEVARRRYRRRPEPSALPTSVRGPPARSSSARMSRGALS